MSAKTFTGLTGSGTGDGFPALDGCPYASCHHDDFATGYDPVSDLCRDYKFDVYNNEAEAVPDIIIPNDRPVGQAGAWVRLEKAGNRIVIEFDAETDVTTPYRVLMDVENEYTLVVEHYLGIPDPLFYSIRNQNNELYSSPKITEDAAGNISYIKIGFQISGTWKLVITPAGQGEPGIPGTGEGSASVSDDAYSASNWDGDTENAPSKNSVRDKIVSMDSAIAANTAKTTLITVSQATDLDTIRTRVAELDAAVVLKGVWDASAETFPGGGMAKAGDSYIVSVGGIVNGIIFEAYDRIIAITNNAATSQYVGNWLKLDYSDQVLTVAGKNGHVTLAIGDIANLVDALAAKANQVIPFTPSLESVGRNVTASDFGKLIKADSSTNELLFYLANGQVDGQLIQFSNVQAGGICTVIGPLVDGGENFMHLSGSMKGSIIELRWDAHLDRWCTNGGSGRWIGSNP